MTTRSPDAPRDFFDDGRAVRIDVHGCSVAAGLRLISRTVREASRKGRASVEVIHGMGDHGSIRAAVRDALDHGDWAEHVSGAWEAGGRTTIHLPLGRSPEAGRIQARDVTGG